MRRIHIVGVSTRTGTTLLAECMRECFEIELAEDVETPLNRLRRTEGIYLTKNPGDVNRLGLRLALDQRLFVLCMMRDPRDVIISKHQRDPRYYHASLKTWKDGYESVQRYAAHPRFLIVKYEDLIADADAVQDRIAARLPFLRKRKPFSEWHTAGGGSVSDRSVAALNGVRAIDKQNKAKWPYHVDRIRREIARFGPIDDELIELGYEPDGGWLERSSALPQKPETLLEKADALSLKKRFLRKKQEWVDYPAAAVTAAACAALSIDFG